MMRVCGHVAAVLLVSACLASTAFAEEPATSDWLSGDHATGDWDGQRTLWSDQGIDLWATYLAEGWRNTTGGIKTGGVYTGLLKAGADVNFDRLITWQGLRFSTTWLWLTGDDASAELVGNSLTISNIAGLSNWRLFEFWLEQSFYDDRFSMRVGWMGWDSEFAVSEYAGLFLNGTFGWPAYLYQNLPEGGPGYPNTGIGWRFALEATDSLTLRSALGHSQLKSQEDNPHGFDYAPYGETGLLWLNEAEFRASPGGLPGRYTLGAWISTKDIESPEDPAKEYHGNYGVYFMVDQQLTSEMPSGSAADEGGSEQGLGWFARVATSPGDRSLVGCYVDTGLNYTGLIPGRDDDSLGIAVAWSGLGYAQEDALQAAGSVDVGYEMVVEATYSFVVANWLRLQPDLQYVVHPGGTGDLDNAFVIGARLSADF